MTRNALDVKKPRDIESTGFFKLFRNALEVSMVPEAGIEPARRERRGILNRLAPFASYNM
jgi:hypothetical protein